VLGGGPAAAAERERLVAIEFEETWRDFGGGGRGGLFVVVVRGGGGGGESVLVVDEGDSVDVVCGDGDCDSSGSWCRCKCRGVICVAGETVDEDLRR